MVVRNEIWLPPPVKKEIGQQEPPPKRPRFLILEIICRELPTNRIGAILPEPSNDTWLKRLYAVLTRVGIKQGGRFDCRADAIPFRLDLNYQRNTPCHALQDI